MRIFALAKRILTQLSHDKRTLALMFGAPLLLLTLIYFVLDGDVQQPTVGITNAPLDFVEQLEAEGIKVERMSESEAYDALLNSEIVAGIGWENSLPHIQIDGTDMTKATLVLQNINGAIMAALGQSKLANIDFDYPVDYLYGYSGITAFDRYGSLLIGFITFFLVFVVAGISFLQERSGGTLEKLLSTPIRRWEIVLGYTLGFGSLTIIQSLLIVWYSIYVLDILMIGNFAAVMLITLLTAMVALTLGIMLSTAAHNEFQVIQFIPMVIVPQVFFTGLVDLTPTMQAVGNIIPLHYTTDALTKVMIKGAGLADIIYDAAALLVFALLFMILNTLMLRKHRKI